MYAYIRGRNHGTISQTSFVEGLNRYKGPVVSHVTKRHGRAPRTLHRTAVQLRPRVGTDGEQHASLGVARVNAFGSRRRTCRCVVYVRRHPGYHVIWYYRGVAGDVLLYCCMSIIFEVLLYIYMMLCSVDSINTAVCCFRYVRFRFVCLFGHRMTWHAMTDASRAGGKGEDGRDIQVALGAGDCGPAESASHHEVRLCDVMWWGGV